MRPIVQKANPVRSRALLDECHDYPCALQLAGCRSGPDYPSVAAHSNLPEHGKGAMMKADDRYAFPACVPCHYELDQGRDMTRDQRRDATLTAIERYHVWRDSDRVMA
jgi:hypothetical protein